MSNPSLSEGHLGPWDGRPGADFASIQLIHFKLKRILPVLLHGQYYFID
jgi:hypothetical protein